MPESQAILKLEIGTTEPEKTILKPAKVKIVNVTVEFVEKAKTNKAVFDVKHPDKEDLIRISSVSFIQGREVATKGTWVSLDKEGKLQKGSALVNLLNKLGVSSLEAAIGKDVDTELNGSYLCFKAY